VPCDSDACCCVELPVQVRTPQAVADHLRSAFTTKDLRELGLLLATDARWGDDDHPDKCRSRADVIGTFHRLLGEGVEGEVTDCIVREKGVAVRLHVQWPEPGQGRGVDFYQAYIVDGGLVTEIQRHDDRRSAIAAVSH